MAIFSSGRGLVLTTLVASVFLVSCGGTDASGSSVTTVAGLPGEKLYQQNCVSCHGKTGDLGVSGAANLKKSTKTLEEKIEFIKTGSANGLMIPYGKEYGGPLNGDQIQSIGEYIETL